jgi:hypothetical protein
VPTVAPAPPERAAADELQQRFGNRALALALRNGVQRHPHPDDPEPDHDHDENGRERAIIGYVGPEHRALHEGETWQHGSIVSDARFEQLTVTTGDTDTLRARGLEIARMVAHRFSEFSTLSGIVILTSDGFSGFRLDGSSTGHVPLRGRVHSNPGFWVFDMTNRGWRVGRRGRLFAVEPTSLRNPISAHAIARDELEHLLSLNTAPQPFCGLLVMAPGIRHEPASRLVSRVGRALNLDPAMRDVARQTPDSADDQETTLAERARDQWADRGQGWETWNREHGEHVDVPPRFPPHIEGMRHQPVGAVATYRMLIDNPATRAIARFQSFLQMSYALQIQHASYRWEAVRVRPADVAGIAEPAGELEPEADSEESRTEARVGEDAAHRGQSRAISLSATAGYSAYRHYADWERYDLHAFDRSELSHDPDVAAVQELGRDVLHRVAFLSRVGSWTLDTMGALSSNDS